MATSTEKKKNRSSHQPTGRWIRVDKRLAIYLRDHFTCLTCGRDLHGEEPFHVTLDHIIPKSGGGSNHESNLFTCCRSCNCSRQDKAIETFANDIALARINKHRELPLKTYRKLAKSILADEVGRDVAVSEIRSA